MFSSIHMGPNAQKILFSFVESDKIEHNLLMKKSYIRSSIHGHARILLINCSDFLVEERHASREKLVYLGI